MYLRRKKFCLDRAFKSFEDMKLFERKFPQFFCVDEKDIDNYLDDTHGIIRMLKYRAEDGSRIVLIDNRKNVHSPNNFLRFCQNLFTAFLFEEEETQIAGVTVIYDCTAVSFKSMKKQFSPIVYYHFFSQMNFYPIRVKQINIVGLPSYGTMIYEFIRNFFSKKLRSRINVVKTSVDLGKVGLNTSDLLTDDGSDYNEDHFVPINDSIRRALQLYYSYDIDYEWIKNNKNYKTSAVNVKKSEEKTFRVQEELAFD
jgi:hypothetical protein